MPRGLGTTKSFIGFNLSSAVALIVIPPEPTEFWDAAGGSGYVIVARTLRNANVPVIVVITSLPLINIISRLRS
jgi:hypothetical protein